MKLQIHFAAGKINHTETAVGSPFNVSHFREGKQIGKREGECENGEIKSTALASFAAFDGAEKEMFWTDNPCLW